MGSPKPLVQGYPRVCQGGKGLIWHSRGCRKPYWRAKNEGSAIIMGGKSPIGAARLGADLPDRAATLDRQSGRLVLLNLVEQKEAKRGQARRSGQG